MKNAEMTRAILSINPAAEFCLAGEDFENIQWLSPGIEKPKLAAIEAKWAEIKGVPLPEPEKVATITERLAALEAKVVVLQRG